MKTYDSPHGKMTVPDSPVTRNIAGHEIKLEAGQRYLASRPMNDGQRTEYPVSIRRLVDERVDPDLVIDGLNYEEANKLLAAFNNGVTSFSGRLW
jgi:hypothetical protein